MMTLRTTTDSLFERAVDTSRLSGPHWCRSSRSQTSQYKRIPTITLLGSSYILWTALSAGTNGKAQVGPQDWNEHAADKKSSSLHGMKRASQTDNGRRLQNFEKKRRSFVFRALHNIHGPPQNWRMVPLLHRGVQGTCLLSENVVCV